MELKDTVEMMQSADYKERFKAEYHQTLARYEKLKKYIIKIEAAGSYPHIPNACPMPPHDCPEDLLIRQEAIMGEYLHILALRAEIERIEL
jgi:hypothetical protein